MKRLLAASLFAMFCGACAEEPEYSTNRDAPTFDEFVAETLQMEDGAWIVNGDEPVWTLEELRTFYDAVYNGGELIVNTVGGQDDKWSAAQVGNMTYCVSTKFGANHARVAAAVAEGAGKWEQASSAIDFVYLSQHDGNCTTRNNNVLFSVEPTKSGSIYARAFFPSYSDRNRNVLVNASLTFNGDYDPGAILGHELGHALGFRHEHTRPEAGTCFEDNNWRPLTPYDQNSIMHYPWCNGGNGALTFSSNDGAGARALYGN